MTEIAQNPTPFLRALFELEHRITRSLPLPHTESGCKFLLLSLLYETQDVLRMFQQAEVELKDTPKEPYIPLYDRDVDYTEWSSERHFQFASCVMEWPEKEQNLEISNGLHRLLDAFSKAKGKAPLELTPYMQKLNEALWNQVDGKLMWTALMKMLEQLQAQLKEVGSLLKRIKINKDGACLLFNGKQMNYNLKEAQSVRDEFEEWKQQWEDEQIIRNHLKGKYLKEIQRLFQTGLLAPYIERQKDVDPNAYEEELLLQQLKGQGNEFSQDTFYHYAAMRELFRYRDGWLEPIPETIGRYFHQQRRHVHEEHHKACFRFIQMTQLLQNEEPQQAAPATVAKTVKHKQGKPKTPSQRGRKETKIFLKEDLRTILKTAVCSIYSQYWNESAQMIIVEKQQFGLTQFLLSIYFVCVERELTISILEGINSQYHRFLSEDCDIKHLASEKTFRTNLRKVVDVGMDFHLLDQEKLDACNAPNKLKTDEWQEWKQTVAICEKLLLKEGVITEKSLGE